MKREIVAKRREYVKTHIIREEIKEIAKKWGVHPSTIEKDLIFLRENEGLKSKSQLRDERIATLYAKGMSAREIAEDINVSARDIYYRIKALEG